MIALENHLLLDDIVSNLLPLVSESRLDVVIIRRYIHVIKEDG